MDFAHGFALLRPLGIGHDGASIPFHALTAIHMVHRMGAVVVLTAIVLLAWRLAATMSRAHRRFAHGLVAVAAWQLVSGLGNVVLGWPLAAAVAHTGGAAALITLLTVLLARAHQATAPSRHAAAVAPAAYASNRP
jgi:cytochrome c oxidase assembly protein subunit 15